MKYYMSNIHDRDEYSKQEIMTPEEIEKCVEKWLENNSYEELLKDHGVEMCGQSFGQKIIIEIDTRDGKISCYTTRQNSYCNSDSFFITLMSMSQIEDILEKDILYEEIKVNALQAKDYFNKFDVDPSQCCYQKNPDGSWDFDVDYDHFSMKEWCDYWSSVLDGFDSYEDRKENTIDYYIEETVDQYEETQNNIDEYYYNLGVEE